ncbi:hypothetical protein ABPG75_009933 [Micractinium tetrahymenae]
MRGLLAAALAAALLACAHAGDDVIAVSGQEHLDELIAKHPFLVAEFYAPWCGHCKQLEPEWAKAAAALKGHNPEVVLVKVDVSAEENEGLKSKYSITGFPTIKIFRGDASQPSAYEGPHEEEGIVNYLKKQAGPAYKKLESGEAVAAAREAAEGALLLAYVASDASEEFKTFAEVAEALRNDLDFGYVTDHSLVEECKGGDCASPFVVIYKKGESDVPRYEGKFKADQLKTWAVAKSLPLVIRFGPPSQMKAVQKAFEGSLPRLVAMAPEDGVSDELMEQLSQASKASNDLAVILATETEGKRIIDYYGAKPAGKVTLLLDDPEAKAKYLKRDVKPSDVPEFVRDLQEGALAKWMKSEEVPATNDEPVRVVVGTTFEEEVFKSGKDVFIEIYAPRCGHCVKLKPTWDELGKEFQADGSVVIAKMDGTINDVPTDQMVVRGFPTLYFVTADGQVKKYEGGRSKEELAKFVRENCTKCGKAKPAEAEDDVEAEAEEAAEEEKKDEL